MGEIDFVALPLIGADGHVLDEAHLQTMLAGEASEGNDFRLGEMADADGVDFDGMETDLLGRKDAFQDFVQSITPGNLAKSISLECVEAYIDAAQPGVVQGLGLAGEENAVGGQADVADARNPADHFDKSGQFPAHERLPAGQANFVDA